MGSRWCQGGQIQNNRLQRRRLLNHHHQLQLQPPAPKDTGPKKANLVMERAKRSLTQPSVLLRNFPHTPHWDSRLGFMPTGMVRVGHCLISVGIAGGYRALHSTAILSCYNLDYNALNHLVVVSTVTSMPMALQYHVPFSFYNNSYCKAIVVSTTVIALDTIMALDQNIKAAEWRDPYMSEPWN